MLLVNFACCGISGINLGNICSRLFGEASKIVNIGAISIGYTMRCIGEYSLLSLLRPARVGQWAHACGLNTISGR